MRRTWPAGLICYHRAVLAAALSLVSSVLAAESGPAFKLNHEPLACVVEDRFPLVEATIEPSANVVNAEVYFKVPSDETYHYLPMAVTSGRFRAKLPKPRGKAGAVVYYIQAADASGATQRTPAISAQIVKRRDACPDGGTVAAEGSAGDVRIYSTTSSSRKPAEFSGIGAVSTAPVTAGEETRVAEPRPAPTPAPGSSLPIPASPGPLPSPADLSPPLAKEFEYQIGPDDILKIAVFGYDDMTQTVLVQPDGTFMYPLVGRVKGSDMTPKELERKLVVLLGKGFIRNPQVTVTVQEARSRSVYVLGEVARAGSYSLVEAKTVLDLAARAGISNTADIMIVRPRGNVRGPVLPAEVEASAGDPQKRAEILRVSMRDLQAGDLSQNLPLQPNDTIFVIAGKRVYVLGEVKSPGGLAPPVGATVEQMILLAGGFTDRASRGSLQIAREEGGKKREFKAKPGDPVLPGDIITVKAKLF